ncbi:unnamed protein product [Polarella glacialis]|uniref:Enoyl reductase (ER) domain-containing protein n=1 Tax=Polarella glacialis TaxID=89957 RepID=A0A813H330_POLGL|nr:unnamed protein product [Polarella glacialis]|mmetsp:Transcript_71827/g.115979  ORF Transcript_71827/g.115979 Transcript_71827/m.115979 type:complete len:444 (+) Transcript_71827:67-1398(+)
MPQLCLSGLAGAPSPKVTQPLVVAGRARHQSLWQRRHSAPLLSAFSAGLIFAAAVRSPCSIVRRQGRMAAMAAMAATPEVPESFRRLVAERAGESVRAVAVVREGTTPEPEDGQVLIKVITAGINGGCETFRARGERAFAGMQNVSDYALGSEGAGVVLRAGTGTDLQPGDAVAFVGNAFAELNIVKASSCHRFGRASDMQAQAFRECAALRISGLTALVALELTGEIKQGQTILITAAAGGTGHFAVQIAKLNGARVIATCSTEEKAKLLRELGADRVVLYKQEDLSEVLSKEFPEGLDLVYEGVGGKLHETALAHLKEGGRQLQVGYISHYPQAAGKDSSPDSSTDQGKTLGDAFWGGKTWELPGNKTVYFNVWEGLKRQTLSEPPGGKPLERLFNLWSSGRLKAMVDPKAFVGLEQAADAVEFMMSGTSTGKVALDIQAL